MIKKYLLNNTLVKFSLLILTVAAAVFFPTLSVSFNRAVENSFYFIKGESQPDSSIIIIELSESDINAIGPWPVKRNYYALLIKKLSELGVRKTGLEVFLSSRNVAQTIYDNLLVREIENAGNVVLSSVAGSITLNGGRYLTDSLSYPSPKLINENFTTGHLNYLTDERIIVPLDVKSFNDTESAFSLKLAEVSQNSSITDELVLNFHSGWNKFRVYSLIDFFNLVEEDKDELNSFKDKIVIIGATDSRISQSVRSYFDDEIPGVALHAFAVDNLLNKRAINTDFSRASVFLFIALAAALILYSHRKNILLSPAVYLILFLCAYAVFYLLFHIDFLILNYFYFILPLLLFSAVDLVTGIYERNVKLELSREEADALKKLLEKKENELSHLQRELNISKESDSELLMERIRVLKSEIEKMKATNDDEIPAKLQSGQQAAEFEGIVYKSKSMQKIADLIRKAASDNITVLITGESGTGKELVARAIHNTGSRKNNSFIAVNCGALSENLLESELFGHIKGAFTGAVSDKQGRFESADKGTIFLDEIAETSESFQVKLLRVLQSGEFEKLGSDKTIKVDTRIIAATNKNPEQQISEKKFREDLYYRLNVFRIELPPLRERKEDIPILADHFLKREGVNAGLSKAALDMLCEYNWKGNVRELEAAVKRAAIFAKYENRNLLRISDFPEDVIKNVKLDFETLVIASLREKEFSHSAVSDTAKELGNVNRTVVAENLRGFSFRVYVENEFNLRKSALIISDSDKSEVIQRVEARLEKYLRNLRSDVETIGHLSFDEVKQKFTSKYKNLPQRYHIYLDEIIKKIMK